jgi:hypothetical protein
MNDITVEPLSQVPPVWVAGGQQYAHAASPDKAEMSRNVLDRICRWDGWIVRPTSHPTQMVEDLAEIDAELARRGTSRAEKNFTVAHENFCWVTDKATREEAVEEQKRYMLGVVSDERPWDYIEAVYLTGTIDDIQRGIQKRIDAGVEEIFLHTMTADLRQLDLFAKNILEPFAGTQVKAAR